MTPTPSSPLPRHAASRPRLTRSALTTIASSSKGVSDLGPHYGKRIRSRCPLAARRSATRRIARQIYERIARDEHLPSVPPCPASPIFNALRGPQCPTDRSSGIRDFYTRRCLYLDVRDSKSLCSRFFLWLLGEIHSAAAWTCSLPISSLESQRLSSESAALEPPRPSVTPAAFRR